MKFRVPLLALFVLLSPHVASADYLDVIVNRLNDGCSLEKYLATVQEFRDGIKAEGYTYTVEIATPYINDTLDVIYWVGRTDSFATFGAESDRWVAAIAKSGTVEAAVNAKLNACTTNVSRSGSRTM